MKLWPWCDNNKFTQQNYIELLLNSAELFKGKFGGDFDEAFKRFMDSHVTEFCPKAYFEITLTSDAGDGLNKIINVLDKANDNKNVRIFLVSPPLYLVSLEGPDKIFLIEELKRIEKKIKEYSFNADITYKLITSFEYTKGKVNIGALSKQEIESWMAKET